MWNFKGFRDANRILHEFTLADLPFINSDDYLSLFYIVAKDFKKYEPIFEHLMSMIMCYILDIAKMDVEITSILKKRPILKPDEQLENIQALEHYLQMEGM
ncbi:unnamed protein product [Lactuca saligna]|uniref:Uncharacterized protein n=1 Tax=Lactuca saligna TaxID=75948 RepID=A0AA35VHE8_LACSI|nr:unnamed protein product [Lactuca saligna]